MFSGGRLGGRLHLIAEDGTVLVERAGALVVVAGPIEPAVRLQSAAVDPDLRRILAFGAFMEGRCWEFVVDEGWRPGRVAAGQRCGVVWHSGQRRPWVSLGHQYDWRHYGRSAKPFRLLPYDDLEPAPPTPVTSHVRGLPSMAPKVAFDLERRQWLRLDTDLTPAVADPDGEFRLLRPPFHPAPADEDDASNTGVEVVYLSHAPNGPLTKLVGDRHFCVDPRRPSGTSTSVTAAGPDGGYQLDHRGELTHVTGGRTRQRLAPPWGGLSRLEADENSTRCEHPRLVHDPAGDRLILWHGRAARTWFFRDGGWSRGPAGAHPPAGPAHLAATAAGVYCLSGGELWVLNGERWLLVGPSAVDAPRLLFSRRARPGLWAVTDDAVLVWRNGDFQPVAVMPGPVVLRRAEPGVVRLVDTRTTAVHDPAGDRLLLWGGSRAWVLSLGERDPGTDVPTGHAVAAPPDVEPATDLPPARSGYLLEISVAPGGMRHGEMFLYPQLAQIRGCLDQTVFSPDPQTRDHYRSLVRNGTVHLWVVQEGLR